MMTSACAEATSRGRDTEGFPCQGCRSGMLYIFAGCAQCEIRACADGKGISHCGLCAEFPSNPLRAFQSDGHIHHANILIELVRLRNMGLQAWLAGQEERWRCSCGESFSWYEDTCHKCGKELASYGYDPTLR